LQKLLCVMYAIPSLTNCVFSENHTSTYYGGGMHNCYSSPMLTNCIFYANTVGVDGFDDFIVARQVAGPYFEGNRNHSSELFVIAFPPETASSHVNWSLMPAGTDPKRPWILDLLKLYPGNSRAAYVRAWIKSEKRRHVVLEMGSDDGIKAWLGGKTVHANNIARAAIPGSDKADITLETGWNRLMLKITQNVLPWEFCARIRNADGGKVEGIEIDCFHEESSAVVEQGS